MKIGISAFAWTANFRSSHLELLPAMKELGLNGIEIPMFDPERLPIDNIRRAFEKNDLDCTVCAILPPGINPISPEKEIRRISIEHLKRCIDAAAAMGAKLLGGPLFAPIGYLPEHRPTGDEWAWAIEVFQALSSVLEATNMQLSIEPVNRAETFFLRTAEAAAQLCESVGDSHIGVTIDTFHANIEERSVPDAIRSLGRHLRHIHASENDRGPLGRGHVPFDEIVSTLREVDYQGYVMIEGFGYTADEPDSPGYLWAHRDVSPEKLVLESYQYLTRLMANSLPRRS
jgi:D-psicose/D-tagatose/L-ribulose 3-epimerase